MSTLPAITVPIADYMHDAGTGSWLLMIGGMLVFWGLIAWVLVTLVRGRDSTQNAGPASALDVLDRRLASGEITVQDYEARRQAIEDPDAPPAGPQRTP